MAWQKNASDDIVYSSFSHRLADSACSRESASISDQAAYTCSSAMLHCARVHICNYPSVDKQAQCYRILPFLPSISSTVPWAHFACLIVSKGVLTNRIMLPFFRSITFRRRTPRYAPSEDTRVRLGTYQVGTQLPSIIIMESGSSFSACLLVESVTSAIIVLLRRHIDHSHALPIWW